MTHHLHILDHISCSSLSYHRLIFGISSSILKIYKPQRVLGTFSPNAMVFEKIYQDRFRRSFANRWIINWLTVSYLSIHHWLIVDAVLIRYWLTINWIGLPINLKLTHQRILINGFDYHWFTVDQLFANRWITPWLPFQAVTVKIERRTARFPGPQWITIDSSCAHKVSHRLIGSLFIHNLHIYS